MTACTVCTNPLIGVVTSMLDCQAGANEIAAATGCTVSEIESHINVCCAVPAAPDSIGDALAASDERLRILSDRISTAIVAAGLSGDSRAQLTGLSLAVRTELENRRRLEDQAKSAVRTLPLDQQQWTEQETAKFHAWLDQIIPLGVHLVDLTVEQVAAEFASLDPGGVMQKELAEDLRGHAAIWISHQSDIPAIPETFRIFLYRVEQMKKRDAALQKSRFQETTR